MRQGKFWKYALFKFWTYCRTVLPSFIASQLSVYWTFIATSQSSENDAEYTPYVNQPSWPSGNAIVLIWSERSEVQTSGRQTRYSFANSSQPLHVVRLFELKCVEQMHNDAVRRLVLLTRFTLRFTLARMMKIWINFLRLFVFEGLYQTHYPVICSVLMFQ